MKAVISWHYLKTRGTSDRGRDDRPMEDTRRGKSDRRRTILFPQRELHGIIL